MVNHMKTTLNISDVTMRALKREAARRGETMSSLVEAALREKLSAKPLAVPPPKLPSFHMGKPLVNIADLDDLYDAMEER